MAKKTRSSNIETLRYKNQLKQQVKERTKQSFGELEQALVELVTAYNEQLDKASQISLRSRSERILQLTVDDDTLIFALQTTVYQFDRDHKALQTPYVTDNLERSFVGVINIYDFLTDSFTYERNEDEGYMIARVFVNKEGAFFVEGKRQRNMGITSYGKNIIDVAQWTKIIETAVKYAVEMDALVPPYETQMITNQGQMALEILQSKSKNGKRLGFRFRADDVD